MAWQVLNGPDLTNEENINAIAEAEAGLLECMSDLFYNKTTPLNTLVNNIRLLGDIDVEATLIKDLLCTYACKELSIADIINSLSCKVALENGLIKEKCECNY